MGRVVDEADASAQGVVAAVVLALVDVRVHLCEAVGRIIIIGGGVVDGGSTDARSPVTVPTSDEGHVVEVARVGHGVLLVLQDLVDDGGELRRVLCRHAAVEHVGEVVVVDAAVIEVGHLLCGRARSVGYLGHIAHEDEESRRRALADTRVIEVLHIAADGAVGAASLGGGHHVHVDAFLDFPVDPGLQCADVVLRRDHNHVGGIGHQVGVVVVNVKDLAVVEHLLVDAVEIRAVGAEQHALGLSTVGTVKGHFHLDVVEDAQDVGSRVVAHRIDNQRADADAAQGALHFDGGCGFRGEAAGLVGRSVVDKLHFFKVLVLADRRLMRQDGTDAIIREAVIRCRVVDHADAWRGTKRHSQQLV